MADDAISLSHEVREVETAADKVALGDMEIRKRFARDIMWLFVAANAFVFVALGIVFWRDNAQLAAHQVGPDQRVIDGKVIMSLLGATTVQLGAAIYTITRAIFPLRGGAG